MISSDDYLWYVDTALDSMIEIVSSLGDDLANRSPDLPGANSPYAILTHCLGVMAYWGGEAVAGRDIERDRAAEFVATGNVADLVERAREARRQFASDVAVAEPDAPPRGAVPAADRAIPIGRTQGGVLFHVYEELSQHLGQMEISRDNLLR
jgi:Protein of unknown function (DUF664)